MVPVAGEVNGARHHFLSRSRFSFNQDGGINMGDLIDPLEYLFHRFAFSHQIAAMGFFIQQKPEIMNLGHIVEEKYSSLGIARIVLDLDIHPIEMTVLPFYAYGYFLALIRRVK